jgi:urease accessory protein
MIRAIRVLPAGEWPRAQHLTTDTVALDYDERHRRRIAMKGKRGLEFLLDLDHATALRDGDALELEDGRLVLVSARREPLAEITAPTAGDLLRIAWHIGNRHLAAQLLGDRVRIRRDHVIEAMVTGLGAKVDYIDAAFEPEAGAYAHAAHTHHHASPAIDHDDRLDDGPPAHRHG